MTLLWILNIALVVAVLALSAIVFALIRQVGILYERIAPLGALVTNAGPEIGAPVRTMSWPTIDGASVAFANDRGRHVLLFFLSPTCPVCKKLLPVLFSLAEHEGDWLDIVLASDGRPEEHAAFVARNGLARFPYVLSQPLGLEFRVAQLPFAAVLDPAGIVKAKGLVNTREQLESLLGATEMGRPTIQHLLGGETAQRRRADA